jgi:hypothetical protein
MRASTSRLNIASHASYYLAHLISNFAKMSPLKTAFGFRSDDVKKLESVRIALETRDIAAAAEHGRVFKLTPVST